MNVRDKTKCPKIIEKIYGTETSHKTPHQVFPEPERIFGFFTEEKKSYFPLLEVDLNSLDSELDGKACFCFTDDTLYYRYNRFFLKDEIEIIESLKKDVLNELIWFWQEDSSSNNPEKYWKIYWKNYFKISYSSFNKKETLENEIELQWKMGLKFLHFRNKCILKNSIHDYWLLYWMKYWESYAEGCCSWKSEDWYEELTLKIEKNPNSDRFMKIDPNIIDGYFEFGGSPDWWQLNDRTPLNPDGDKMIFIGQFWTDYLEIADRLIYIFYCPKYSMTTQIYDID